MRRATLWAVVGFLLLASAAVAVETFPLGADGKIVDVAFSKTPTITLTGRERSLFGGSLYFSVVADADGMIDASLFGGTVKTYDKAFFEKTESFSAYPGKWEFLETATVNGTVDKPYLKKESYACFNNETQKDDFCDREISVSNLTSVTETVTRWVPIEKYDGTNVKAGSTVYLRQTVERGVPWYKDFDLIPSISGKEYAEYAFIYSNATREVNKTIQNPTGHSISNATFEVRFNQTELTGSSCAQNALGFAISDGSGQYALNSSGRGVYPLAFNNSNGEFIFKVRAGGLTMAAGASMVVSAYCGAQASYNASDAYYDFGSKTAQDGVVYFSNGAAIKDVGPDLDHPDSQAGTFTYTGADFWGNTTGGAFNHTSTGADYVRNTALYLNTTKDLTVCRFATSETLAASTNEYLWYDAGGGYWNPNIAGAAWNTQAFNGYNAGFLLAGITNFVYKSYAWLYDNGNMTSVGNGLVEQTDATGAAGIVTGNDMTIGAPGFTWMVRGAMTECGFIKGPPNYINEDWVRVFQNTTLAMGNYTVSTGVSIPYWTSNSTLRANGTAYSYGAYDAFNVSWTNNSVLTSLVYSINGTNYTMSTGQNKTFTTLKAGYYSWNVTACTSAGCNQTDTWGFTISKDASNLTLHLNGSIQNFTLRLTEQSNLTCMSNTSYAVSVSVATNGTTTQSGSSPLSNSSVWLTPESYGFVCSFAGDENFTSATTSAFTVILTAYNPLAGGGGAALPIYAPQYVPNVNVTVETQKIQTAKEQLNDLFDAFKNAAAWNFDGKLKIPIGFFAFVVLGLLSILSIRRTGNAYDATAFTLFFAFLSVATLAVTVVGLRA